MSDFDNDDDDLSFIKKIIARSKSKINFTFNDDDDSAGN
jgi:hypothetical protein